MNPILAEAEAVLFDMDGTLIDSKPVIEQAWCRIAKKYDVSIDREIIDEHIHGRSGEYTMNYLFKDFVHSQRADIKLEVDHIEETSPADLISGAREFLLLLRRNKIKTALVTASWQKKIDFLFALHNLHGLFDVVISCHDVQKGKPDPQGYLLAANRLACRIQHCVVFEDSISGIAAGVKSGAKCIGIGNAQGICHSDAFFADFHQVMSAIGG